MLFIPHDLYDINGVRGSPRPGDAEYQWSRQKNTALRRPFWGQVECLNVSAEDSAAPTRRRAVWLLLSV